MIGSTYYYVGDVKFFNLTLTTEDVVDAVEAAGLTVVTSECTTIDVLDNYNDHMEFMTVQGKKPNI